MESFNTQEFATPQEAATYHRLTQIFQTHVTTHRLSFADARYVGIVLLGDVWVPWAARRGMSPTLGQDCSLWLQRRVRARQHRTAAFVFYPCQEASAEEPPGGTARPETPQDVQLFYTLRQALREAAADQGLLWEGAVGIALSLLADILSIPVQDGSLTLAATDILITNGVGPAIEQYVQSHLPESTGR
ncbi:MAG TPA: hypothetical protein VI542_14270 [Candidatus Tectomicrobia bacterium]